LFSACVIHPARKTDGLGATRRSAVERRYGLILADILRQGVRERKTILTDESPVRFE
jgi:hypothetical protein